MLSALFETPDCVASASAFMTCYQFPIAALIGGSLAVVTAVIASRSTRAAANKSATALEEAAQKNFDAARLGAEAALRAAESAAEQAALERAIDLADRRHNALLVMYSDFVRWKDSADMFLLLNNTDLLVAIGDLDDYFRGKAQRFDTSNIVRSLKWHLEHKEKTNLTDFIAKHGVALDRKILTDAQKYEGDHMKLFKSIHEVRIRLPGFVEKTSPKRTEQLREKIDELVRYAHATASGLIAINDAILEGISKCQLLRDQAMTPKQAFGQHTTSAERFRGTAAQ